MAIYKNHSKKTLTSTLPKFSPPCKIFFLKQVYKKQNSAHLLAHAHELKVTPFTTTINTAWKLLRDYKGDESSASPQLPSQMRTNISADKRMWTEGDIQREPHIGIKRLHQHRFHLDHDLPNHPLSPWDESEADRVTKTLYSPHPSDSHIPDPELNKPPTRAEVKEMLKHLPSDKAAGPDGITNHKFIDFATAYSSVQRERLGLTLQNYKITGKIWHLLKENSRSVRLRVLHALIAKKMKWTFSAVSLKEADLALSSLAFVWQNLFLNYEPNSHSLNSL